MTPDKRYGAILSDPPWRFSTWSAKGRDRCPDAPVKRSDQRKNTPVRHYETMSLDEIRALPVPDLAEKDCVLFLWAVDPMIPEALDLGKHWGFKYKTPAFYWVKTRRNNGEGNKRPHAKERPYPMGTGYWTRANPEICLLFTRGKPERLSAGVEKLIVSPRREHSRKPDEIYERIQALVGGPYLEMFARQRWPGWDAWGNETTKFSPGEDITEEDFLS